MKLSDLKKFVEIEDEKLMKRYSNFSGQKEMILARTVKLGEEFGELCEGVLAHNSLQRKQKLDSYSRENLPEEFADVIITTLLLAKSINVDFEKALEKKMQKINRRG